MRLKERIKHLLFAGCDSPLWVPVGVAEAESPVRLSLRGVGSARDVTHSCAVASLRPFMIGVACETAVELADLQRMRLSLRVEDGAREGRELAHIGLRAIDVLPFADTALVVCRPSGHRNLCLPQSRIVAQRVYDRYSRWRNRHNRNPYNFELAPRDLECMCLFYIRPRPVVLVSVVDGARANIFPMDLIGPVGPSCFTLALRCESSAIDLIKHSRRVALSSVPAERVDVAYDFGCHHRKQSIDWADLSIPLTRSAHFGLPVPCFAPRVREMQVDSFHVVGSHTLFVTHPVGEESAWLPEEHYPGALRLCHVPGFVQSYRRQSGQLPYPDAPTTS